MIQNIKFRNIKSSDCENLWNMMNSLDYETRYMLCEPGERIKNLERFQNFVDSTANSDDFFYLALNEEEIVGYISAQIGNVNRLKHSAYIVVGIREKYRGHGIGTYFFKELDKWAEEKNLVRLELTVVSSNENALHLYKKSGFEIEGTKIKSMLIDGQYENEYYMSKILR